MASFTRKSYELVFKVARAQYFYFLSRDEEKEKDAVKLMWMVEDCIGQQSDFPLEARKDWPRDKLDLPEIWSA